MALKHDPILGTEREVGIIQQRNADPSSPKKERAWVTKSGGSTEGTPLGLLLTLTYEISGGAGSYELRYRTKDGVTKGVALT